MNGVVLAILDNSWSACERRLDSYFRRTSHSSDGLLCRADS
jgi:hypothetical protein